MVCERRFRGGETREFMVVASLRGDCWARNRISFGSIFDSTMSSFFPYTTTTTTDGAWGPCLLHWRTRALAKQLLG